MRLLTLALYVTLIAALVIGTCGCTSQNTPYTTQKLAPSALTKWVIAITIKKRTRFFRSISKIRSLSHMNLDCRKDAFTRNIT